jgi:hypothetical protein
MAHTQQDTDMWVWSTQTAFKQKLKALAPLSTMLFIPDPKKPVLNTPWTKNN